MTERDAQPRRRGRPPLPPGEKKRVTMTFRVSDATRELLVEAAAANNRSVSEEIEYQLISFRNRELFTEELVKQKVGEVADKSWNEKTKSLLKIHLAEILQNKAENVSQDIENLISKLNEIRSVLTEVS